MWVMPKSTLTKFQSILKYIFACRFGNVHILLTAECLQSTWEKKLTVSTVKKTELTVCIVKNTKLTVCTVKNTELIVCTVKKKV